jgi:lysophospholipase L1-like esterase
MGRPRGLAPIRPRLYVIPDVSPAHPFEGPPVPRTYPASLVLLVFLGMAKAADNSVVESMDAIRFHSPREKGKAELVEGKVGRAVRFSFADDAKSVFFTSNLHGTPAWDKAAGLSFWVKGDSSEHFGGLQLIYNEDYSVRYDFAFPLASKEWKKVTIAWGDLVPVLPGPKSKLLDSARGNKPSKITALWFGKWWYWRDNGPCSFAIDDIRLEEKIDRDTNTYRPEGTPLGRLRDKLKARQPVTIVTMGDSLTDTRHWANRETSWPAILKKGIGEKYGSRVTIINPAIGGTQLRQNLVLIPLWLAQAPEPDLVTLCFGANDWDAGMRGEQFRDSYRDAADRVRRATRGRTDVLILTTLPFVARWGTMGELAESCRKAAYDRNTGMADTEKAFLEAGKKDRERLFAWDKTHLSPAGHALIAETVLKAIEAGGR